MNPGVIRAAAALTSLVLLADAARLAVESLAVAKIEGARRADQRPPDRENVNDDHAGRAGRDGGRLDPACPCPGVKRCARNAGVRIAAILGFALPGFDHDHTCAVMREMDGPVLASRRPRGARFRQTTLTLGKGVRLARRDPMLAEGMGPLSVEEHGALACRIDHIVVRSYQYI